MKSAAWFGIIVTVLVLLISPAAAKPPAIEVKAPITAEGRVAISALEGGNLRVKNETSHMYMTARMVDAATGKVLVNYETAIFDVAGALILPGKAKVFDQPGGRNVHISVLTPGLLAIDDLDAKEAEVHTTLCIGWTVDLAEDVLQTVIGATFKNRKGALLRVILKTPGLRKKIMAAYRDEGAAAAGKVVFGTIVGDIMTVGPLTKTALGEELCRKIKEQVAKYVAKKALGAVPVVQAISWILTAYDALKGVVKVGGALAAKQEISRSPAKLSFEVAFAPQFDEVRPPTIRRDDKPQKLRLLGSMLGPRAVDGRVVSPVVTFEAANKERIVDAKARADKGGWILRATLPGTFIRRAKGPLKVTVTLGKKSLGTKLLHITDGAFALKRLEPNQAAPGTTIEALGSGFPSRGQPLFAVFRSKKDPKSLMLTTPAIYLPRSGRARILVPVGLGHRVEDDWMVHLVFPAAEMATKRLPFHELKGEPHSGFPPNWSFERAKVPDGATGVRVPVGSSAIEAWHVDRGTVRYVRSGGTPARWQASDGRASVQIPDGATLLTRILGLPVGDRYELSFDVASAKDGALLDVALGDATRQVKASPPRDKRLRWRRRHMAFTVRSGTGVLKFNGGAGDPVIDNVEIRPFEPLDLTGRWVGTGYVCDGNSTVNEVDIVHENDTGKIVATLATEDPCLPIGTTSWTGRLEPDANRFSEPVFDAEFQEAGRRWRRARAFVLDRNHLVLHVVVARKKTRPMHFLRTHKAPPPKDRSRDKLDLRKKTACARRDAWAGTWEAAGFRLVTTQSGTTVTGKYEYFLKSNKTAHGTLSGTVKDDTLQATYKWFGEKGSPSGSMTSTLSADCNSMTSKTLGSLGDEATSIWRRAADRPTGRWNGEWKMGGTNEKAGQTTWGTWRLVLTEREGAVSGFYETEGEKSQIRNGVLSADGRTLKGDFHWRGKGSENRGTFSWTLVGDGSKFEGTWKGEAGHGRWFGTR